MRPVRLELSGFAAYRAAQLVDFDGVEFFSLAGPTGAGKSSLIDAMVFALYGRVPRLGGRSVEPVLSAGADQAKVRFHFESNGEVYDATRFVQRTTGGGASVREARLQKGEEVLASGPGDVTTAVEELLSLDFDDFTRTVVLPQGEFAKFLKARPGERQELLRSLLGLDVFMKVRELAKARVAVATDRMQRAESALAGLEIPEESDRESARHRLESLTALRDSMSDGERRLAELEAVVKSAEEAEVKVRDARDRLVAIVAPARLEDLDASFAEARSRVADADEALGRHRKQLEAVELELADLPGRQDIARWRKSAERLQTIEDRLLGDGLDELRAAKADAEQRVAHAADALTAARGELAAASSRHSAHLLAKTLELGEPCPVCAREVDELPVTEELPVVDTLKESEAIAERELHRVREEHQAVLSALATGEATRASLVEQRDSVRSDLEDAPDDLEAMAKAVETLLADVEKKQQLVDQSKRQLETAQRHLEDLADESRRVARGLTEAQLSVADLGPPVSESDDPVVKWKELLEWRDGSLARAVADAKAAATTAEQARLAAGEARTSLIATLEEHGVTAVEPYALQVATAQQSAAALVETHERASARSGELNDELTTAKTAHDIAATLVRYLQSDGFERWLMLGARAELVEGANALLEQLSSGGYSLHSDETGDFSIVDHRNADEVRRVETLSGGETFLVSLALALSLAETLAGKGDSVLDAIILDEGFGTLDDESLETVASVLEELAGKGLMVGVITHVKELARRAPVRYEVTPGAGGATVERLEGE